MSNDRLPKLSSATEVAEFLHKAATVPVAAKVQGRLIFALDATASRQPTWEQACQWQSEMFTGTASLGTLAIQLIWYRGFNEFNATPWLMQAPELLQRMSSVHCLEGMTQLDRVLSHALRETRQHRINALVFVGDCMEESVDRLCHQAGQLGVLGVPVFIFHEGHEPAAATAFRQLAQLSHGAYCAFDAGSAKQLRELLGAVAVYAVGGRQALAELGKRKGGLAVQLTHQLDKR